MAQIEKMIAKTFMDIANGLETGSFGARPRIAVTGLGSEHGEANSVEAAVLAADRGVDVTLIGTAENEKFNTVKVSDEDEMYKEMEKMLDNGDIDGCVTMHYPFPIGVSTVGRVITPGKGKQMFIANTTGTSAAERIEAMIRNTIAGIITAKACGIKNPTVGILNVDGARQCEGALKELQANGYDIHFAESSRADGGCVMRGNDMLVGSPDIMVTDSLTGNIMVKMLSSYTTGGSFEELGTLPQLYEKITVTTDTTYHVQLSGTFYDYDDASRTAAQYSGGFAAYEDGAFYARAGSYTSLSAARSAAAQHGGTAVGGSSTRVTVIVTGPDTILFEFDCGGSENLGILPIETRAKTVTWFRGSR